MYLNSLNVSRRSGNFPDSSSLQKKTYKIPLPKKKNPQTPNKQSRDDGVQSTHKRRQATGNFKQPSNGEVLDIRVRQPGEKKNIKECARKVKGDKEVSRVWVLLSINKK